MTDQSLTYQELADGLYETTLEAGRKIMEIYAREINVNYKEDKSPVTEADEAAEKIILKTLAALTPAIPVIAEEQANAGNTPDVEDKFWLVDPLDGTKEFIKKGTDFTVNIALIENGLPTFGIVYAPALGRMFVAKDPQTAVQMDVMDEKVIGQETPLMVRDVPPTGIVAVASKSHRDAQTNAFLAKNHITHIVSTGSSLKFCLVAAGEADIYPRFGPTMEWDTGAGHAVLRAAGGDVRNPDGTDFRYHKPDFRNGFFIANGKAAYINL
ncbi:3'(2'),5'-bisphosphate nucleotidase CysQ [Paremcibacter congregatus]|uniref:3'(2'),5'-bisphosphate nucleotidase CysQ n=1 Tax=Paremcibacter congregatus TaxID=2043170 RepID=A0A2G4YSD9_9PROT|nr:3'(2'),5'-bisphosphate nucleotidase CysQ [Paremcibacter congregatus]PHZ85238.1 3'(2'),5'-bisphosphate nucleotidase [Paremcibacter congregatus]QDE27828.1 3'(2'),5'-bisphosphate nucleotidase CysQ [Paremcibacter congregatus]